MLAHLPVDRSGLDAGHLYQRLVVRLEMRVATRRARSALQAFGGIIDRDATRPLCAELKWLATELGAARDGEVMLERLTADLAAIPPALVAGPVQARITDCFTAELARAGQSALAALDGQRYLRLLDALDALLADPPLTPRAERTAGKVLAKPVRRAARRLQRALAAVPGAEDRDAAIHEARKTAKRARYAAEAAVPALGRTASRQAAQAKELQQLLGDHHDSRWVLAAWGSRETRARVMAAGGHGPGLRDRCAARAQAGAVTGSRVADAGRVVQPGSCGPGVVR